MILKDGHEVCFVGDEAFRILSQLDTEADSLLSAVSDCPCSTCSACFASGYFQQSEISQQFVLCE